MHIGFLFIFLDFGTFFSIICWFSKNSKFDIFSIIQNWKIRHQNSFKYNFRWHSCIQDKICDVFMYFFLISVTVLDSWFELKLSSSKNFRPKKFSRRGKKWQPNLLLTCCQDVQLKFCFDFMPVSVGVLKIFAFFLFFCHFIQSVHQLIALFSKHQQIPAWNQNKTWVGHLDNMWEASLAATFCLFLKIF